MKPGLPANPDPLAALKDIHLPPPPAWWPPAPGWWLLGGLILLTAMALLIRESRRFQANRPIRLALRELKNEFRRSLTADPKTDTETARIRQMSALLRRFCLARYPNLGTAALSGPAWIDFLSARRPATLSLSELEYLTYVPYAPAAAIESRRLAQILEKWIKGQHHTFFPRRRRRP